PENRYNELTHYVPLDPPKPDIYELCRQACTTIKLLANPDTHSVLALTTERFDWLPTNGGFIRDIAYDLLAPLAYVRLGLPVSDPYHQELLEMVYRVLTHHYTIAGFEPALPYAPEVEGWRDIRYQTPSITWLQGLKQHQLENRLDQFMTTLNRKAKVRLATKEEFKAEFDRILASTQSDLRQSLGVLINPLLGFTPHTRPVYWRILAIQYDLYTKLLHDQDAKSAPFDLGTQHIVRQYYDINFNSGG
ncbi:MAG: hypothetical protein ICV65_08480, partial [Flavisolibacter sp.]|nr:hypothetical protein [Flavisolibacter sp.]